MEALVKSSGEFALGVASELEAELDGKTRRFAV